jgi:hypothetical protein
MLRFPVRDADEVSSTIYFFGTSPGGVECFKVFGDTLASDVDAPKARTRAAKEAFIVLVVLEETDNCLGRVAYKCRGPLPTQYNGTNAPVERSQRFIG